MYLARPVDVPELTGSHGIVPGQVRLVRVGKEFDQYSVQNAS